MRIVSWNVNSVGARLERVTAYLDREAPDVLCLQELKCIEEKFPHEEFRKRGYETVVLGQKTYNGVAVASKMGLTDPVKGFGDGDEDPQARFVGATIAGFRVYSAYVPNGQQVGSDKFQYKLRWLDRLNAYLVGRRAESDRIVVGGDFNVAPDDRDVHDPALWHETILCSTPERDRIRALFASGYEDLFRRFSKEPGQFSWWDYRELGFQLNKGLRIDLLLATKAAAELCTASRIVRDERKGVKPSDHAPVEATFSLTQA